MNLFRRLFTKSDPPPAREDFSSHDVAMMDRALELAQTAAGIDEVPVGCVVYDTKSGEILGEGFNRREVDQDPVAHAEIIAITQAAKRLGSWRLNTCTLVVTLEPCIMCAGACVNARVGRVIFGATDPKAGGTRSLYTLLEDPRLNHRAVVAAGLRADQSAALLRAFFRKLRN